MSIYFLMFRVIAEMHWPCVHFALLAAYVLSALAVGYARQYIVWRRNALPF